MVSIDVNIAEMAVLLSILLRVSIILFMLPMFSASSIPNPVKVCAVLAFSLMLFPIISRHVNPLPLKDLSSLAVVIAGEVVYGILFALSMLLVISAFQLAGELIAFEMGFGFSQTADPQTGARFTVLGVWAQLLAVMIFFVLNGHHIVLRLIVESFRTIPVGSFALDPSLFGKIILLAGLLFVLAMKLAAPVMAVLILTQIALGLMSKFAPQINILATSFPITITLGILFLGLTVAVWGELAHKSFAELLPVPGTFRETAVNSEG
ncbi:MAG: flagellar biosynthetic protein FliR [Syntrophobacteraceae bacterium]